MNEISKEVKKLKGAAPPKPKQIKKEETVAAPKDGAKKKAIVIMSGVAKKTSDVSAKR